MMTSGRPNTWMRWAPVTLLLTLLASSVLAAEPAAAQSVPILTVSPSNDLIDGQYVRASWSGLDPGTEVQFRQCRLVPITITDCSYLGTRAIIDGGPASASGTGTLSFPVNRDLNLAPGGGFTAYTFTCDDTHPCSIALFTDPDATDLKTAVFSVIKFGISSDACPFSTLNDLSGVGGASTFRAMKTWLGTLCKSPELLSVKFHSTNSIEAEQAFVKGSVDFAITSQPFASGSVSSLSSQHRKFTYAPVLASSLVFAYRMFDPTSGDQITDLKLTPDQVAAIFTGQLKNLNSDPDVVKQNPGVTFPTDLHAIGRGEPSAETRLLTSWFMADARFTYRKGGAAFRRSGVTDRYPHTGKIQLASGARDVARAVANPSSSSEEDGFIGWMDSSYAALYDLPTARVENRAKRFVASTQSSITAAVKSMRRNPDGVTLTPRFAPETVSPKAYPLPVVSYLVVQTNATRLYDDTQGLPLRTMLKYAIGAGQRVLALGYAPLPHFLVIPGKAAFKAIPDTAFVAPTTPPPTPSPGPTGTPPAFVGGVTPPPISSISPTPTTGVTVGSPPPGVLPPTTLSAARDGLLWPALLIAGLAGLVLGLFLALALAVSRRRARALAAGVGDAGPSKGSRLSKLFRRNA